MTFGATWALTPALSRPRERELRRRDAVLFGGFSWLAWFLILSSLALNRERAGVRVFHRSHR
jgi:hypothetical protein